MTVNEGLRSVQVWIESLYRAGVRDVCVSPGSRSTPLTASAARFPKLKIWSILDERAAAFFALGLAKAKQQPVALVCTSGTATANFFPAVMEANSSHVPLVVVTADRPPELREIGSNQTVDQLKLYGTHVKWFYEMPVPDAERVEQMSAHSARMAVRAVATAMQAPSGPIHINYPFREPLMPPMVGEGTNAPIVQAFAGVLVPSDDAMGQLVQLLSVARRPLVVCGPLDRWNDGDSVARFAAHFGVPILADVLSQLRTHSDATMVMDAAHVVLQDPDFLQTGKPDLIIRFGQTPTSKSILQALMDWSGVFQVVVHEASVGPDATGTASHYVQSSVAAICDGVQDRIASMSLDTAWVERWALANDSIKAALCRQVLQDDDLRAEGRLFVELARLMPGGSTLFIGNSMPIRHAETFLFATGKSIHLFGNRGVSGIDGIVSSAFGVSAGQQGPTTLVIGDVSFYHDLPGLMHARRLGLSLQIILVNNDGGGIFTFLPQANYPDVVEHFTTPHGIEFRQAVEMFGGTWSRPLTWSEFQTIFQNNLQASGLQVIELGFDKDESRLWQDRIVRGALDAMPRSINRGE